MLPPVFFHIFRKPLPYRSTLDIQHKIHAIQLQKRRETGTQSDVLLLLQHRPVFTAGRRQVSSPETVSEEYRLQSMGADWVHTQRGGETTFHGPGQVVGYPLLDLGRMNLSIRTYICRLQQVMQQHILQNHGLHHHPSEHTGLFLSEHGKLGSIGVQVRHRLTTHGFAFNVTREPEAWFNQIVACGLPDVHAVSIERHCPTRPSAPLTAESEGRKIVPLFAGAFQRELVPLNENEENAEILQLVRSLEEEAVSLGNWPEAPVI